MATPSRSSKAPWSRSVPFGQMTVTSYPAPTSARHWFHTCLSDGTGSFWTRIRTRARDTELHPHRVEVEGDAVAVGPRPRHDRTLGARPLDPRLAVVLDA